jgi:cytochrome c oxidase cbb3-type subunit 3
VALFVGTIIFAVFYGVYYHAPVPDRTMFDSYDAAVAADLKKRFAGMGTLEISEQNMLLWMSKSDYLAVGRAVFKQNCASCHGAEGQGVTCPNMTDDYYKNVKKITDIPRVIAGGANNGAMPAWGNRLHPNEVALVAAYIASLRGKNLPSQRPREGDLIPPWPKLEIVTTTSMPSQAATATAPAH